MKNYAFTIQLRRRRLLPPRPGRPPARATEARRAAFNATLGRRPAPATVTDLPMEEGLAANPEMAASAVSVLDPIAAQPEFLRTLHLYLASDRDRHWMARRLDVHTRPVDYRIRRIGQLCGRQPQSVVGSAHLLGALVVEFVRDSALEPRGRG